MKGDWEYLSSLACDNHVELKCPKCGYIWQFKGKANRVQCRKCKKFFTRKYKKSADIQDDIMKGNILDALQKVDTDPSSHKELFKDAIPLILKDDDLKFAFSQACSELKKSPETIVRRAVKYWLKDKGFLP